jgi:hypothetical protein
VDALNLAVPTTILLGAGASVDAGVPMSTAMTREIVDALRTRRPQDAGAAVNFAVGALIAHDAARGGSAYGGIDVERLFTAIQMLADRDDLEIAPFVSAWNSALSAFDSGVGSFPTFGSRDLLRAFDANSPAAVERALKPIIESQIPKSRIAAFARLQGEMIMQLRRSVNVDATRVEYLSSLLNLEGTLQVATLNYDRAIEIMAAKNKVSLDTGIGLWRGGAGWSWAKGARIKLLKLHGSIDWVEEYEEAGRGRMPEPKVRVTADPIAEGRPPYVVFGRRGKLRADGPFLAMLLEFEAMLARTRRLVIVGYSFRDDHVNTVLGRWLNLDSHNEVILIDPSFDLRSEGGDDARFRDQLRRVLLLDGEASRLTVIKKTASDGLQELLGAVGQTSAALGSKT